jgi:hypothetical protein
MSTDRDVSRIVRSWLEEGATALPDRVLDNVLDQLPATPQRRAWWPVRRLYDMNNNMKAAIVAAVAVVVVVVAGISLLPAGGVGGPGATPTPLPTPGPTATASPGASPAASQALFPSGRICTASKCTAGALDPGTYYFDEGEITPGRFTFAVPAVGWATEEGFVTKNHDRTNEVALSTWIPSHVYADSCHWRGTLIDVRATIEKLASALVNQKGRQVSGPTDVMLGGFPAKRIEMTVPAELDLATCDDKFLRSWPDPGADESGGLAAGGPGSTDVVYIVDVDGHPLAVVARHLAASSAQDQADLEAIVASIQIDHPAANASPSASP